MNKHIIYFIYIFIDSAIGLNVLFLLICFCFLCIHGIIIIFYPVIKHTNQLHILETGITMAECHMGMCRIIDICLTEQSALCQDSRH